MWGIWELCEPSSQIFKFKIVLKNKVYFQKKKIILFPVILQNRSGKIYIKKSEIKWYNTDKFRKNLFHLALCWLSAEVAARRSSELELLLLHIWQKFPLLTAEKTWHGTLEQNWTGKYKLSQLCFLYAADISCGTNGWILEPARYFF